MEIWLSYNNNEDRLRLPVLPSSFDISVNNINETININNIGEINLIGKSGLKQITLSSFFPAQTYTFVEYKNFPSPIECVNLIEKWRTSGKPIRLIITKIINEAFAIESFRWSEKDSTGDIYFDLDLKQYKFLIIPSQSTNTSYPTTTERETKTIQNEYIVQSGDTLYMIAKKLTGNGSNYITIAEKNNIKNPNKIFPGQKLIV